MAQNRTTNKWNHEQHALVMWGFEKSRTATRIYNGDTAKKYAKDKYPPSITVWKGEDKAGFIFGQGGVPHVLEEYEKGGNTSQTKAAILLTRTIISALVNGSFVRRMFAPMDINIQADEKNTSYTIHCVCFEQHIRCRFWISSLLCSLKNHKIAQFIGFTRHPDFTAFCLPKIRLALPINSKSVQDSVGTEFILTPKEEMLYTIDGDLYTLAGDLVIRVGPAVDIQDQGRNGGSCANTQASVLMASWGSGK